APAPWRSSFSRGRSLGKSVFIVLQRTETRERTCILGRMSGVGRARVLSCLLLSLVTIGCRDDPPNKEIEQAQAAIDTAASAGADDYAHDEIAGARDALKRAHDAVEQRDYRLALNNALDSL